MELHLQHVEVFSSGFDVDFRIFKMYTKVLEKWIESLKRQLNKIQQAKSPTYLGVLLRQDLVFKGRSPPNSGNSPGSLTQRILVWKMLVENVAVPLFQVVRIHVGKIPESINLGTSLCLGAALKNRLGSNPQISRFLLQESGVGTIYFVD